MSLNYEKLVADYLQNLTTVLRGFKPAGELAFLDSWVPDENPTTSILNLIEAAHEARTPAISLDLGPTTLKDLDFAKLEQFVCTLGHIDKRQKGDRVEFTVTFSTADQMSIHPAYRTAVKAASIRRVHSGSLNESDGLTLIQARKNGLTLHVLVDKTHTVKKAAYEGAASDVHAGLLEALCGIIEGSPIQECSDHAAIRLEFQLRDPNMPRPVKGIVMPENADPAFTLPLALTRAIMAEYRIKTGYTNTENRYDPPLSDSWKHLSESERMQIVREALGKHPEGKHLVLARLEGARRAIFQFPGEATSAAKQKILVDIESHLKQSVEPSLQIYLEPVSDANAIRKK